MRAQTSLRVRLTVVILLPLLLIVAGVSYWAVRDAELRAADRFDRSLLVTALGISRDTAFTGGNAVSEGTRDLLRDTSGGPVFYHVYAPDGVFVTGYATPPGTPGGFRNVEAPHTFYDATYLGRPVRAVRFTDRMTIDGLTGPFTFTVWQDTAVRDGFVQSLSRRTGIVLAILLVSVSVIVWFGIRLGLAPLLGLEEAIARRSAKDLRPIARPIPFEVQGIVGRLNALLSDLSAEMRAREELISNAAHQLRNPIAGILALSEAVASAKSHEEARVRSDDLLIAARQASRLAHDLLTLERAQVVRDSDRYPPFDARDVCQQVAASFEKSAADQGVGLSVELPDEPCHVQMDQTLFAEALKNLIANALDHGGPGLSCIEVGLEHTRACLQLAVRDDGKGIDHAHHGVALERFGQVAPSKGSGLGLPIANVVAERAGGQLELCSGGKGLTVLISLPASQGEDARAIEDKLADRPSQPRLNEPGTPVGARAG